MQPTYHTSKQKVKIAYLHQAAVNAAQREPGILFLPGFRSDMQGSKAQAVREYCTQQGIAFTSLDYYAHGMSEGDFHAFTLSKAIENIEEILDGYASFPQIIVGSSMGGCLMLLLALKRPELVAGLIGIAAAPDFTERLMFEQFSAEQHAQFLAEDVVYLPSEYSLEDYPITGEFIRDGRQYLILDETIAIDKPAYFLHGIKDADVPYHFSLKAAERLISEEVNVTLIKDGDHRLSRPSDIALLLATIHYMRAKSNGDMLEN